MISLEKIEHYFDYLYAKAQKTPHRFIQHNDFDIKSIYSQKDDYCLWLYQLYKQNEFKFSILKRKRVIVAGKERWIFQYPLPDLIIHYCIADYIQLKTKTFHNESLYSYKKGKNSNQALYLVDQYIRKYKKSEKKSLKDIGLFVIRKDISKFSDSIKSNETSILWTMLKPLMTELSQQNLRLIRDSLNPAYINEADGPNAKPLLLNHLPMGSPIIGFLTNFYLHHLDTEVSQIKKGLYLRFGDDILFITNKYDTYLSVESTISDYCKRMELNFNLEKSYTTYLTAPGRPYTVTTNNLRNSNYFEYLGMKIDFNEGLCLTNEKYKKLLADLRQVMNNYKTNLKNFNLLKNELYNEQQYQFLIQELNRLLTLNSDKNILYLDKIMKNVSSHKILKKLDLDIAYEILKSAKNIKSKKVFRQNSYKKLREQYKLISLVKYKNEYSS